MNSSALANFTEDIESLEEQFQYSLNYYRKTCKMIEDLLQRNDGIPGAAQYVDNYLRMDLIIIKHSFAEQAETTRDIMTLSERYPTERAKAEALEIFTTFLLQCKMMLCCDKNILEDDTAHNKAYFEAHDKAENLMNEYYQI